ncbi:MAG: UPF0175 family protein [Bacteroidia bacterium]
MIIEIPDRLIAGFSETEIRLKIALSLFQAEIFTLGQASKFTGMNRRDFQRELGKRKIPIHYGQEELNEDLKNINDLLSDSNQ